MGSISKQNPTKTAIQISKTDFYFVTGFYFWDNICIADGSRRPPSPIPSSSQSQTHPFLPDAMSRRGYGRRDRGGGAGLSSQRRSGSAASERTCAAMRCQPSTSRWGKDLRWSPRPCRDWHGERLLWRCSHDCTAPMSIREAAR